MVVDIPLANEPRTSKLFNKNTCLFDGSDAILLSWVFEAPAPTPMEYMITLSFFSLCAGCSTASRLCPSVSTISTLVTSKIREEQNEFIQWNYFLVLDLLVFCWENKKKIINWIKIIRILEKPDLASTWHFIDEDLTSLFRN